MRGFQVKNGGRGMFVWGDKEEQDERSKGFVRYSHQEYHEELHVRIEDVFVTKMERRKHRATCLVMYALVHAIRGPKHIEAAFAVVPTGNTDALEFFPRVGFTRQHPRHVPNIYRKIGITVWLPCPQDRRDAPSAPRSVRSVGAASLRAGICVPQDLVRAAGDLQVAAEGHRLLHLGVGDQGGPRPAR